MIKDVRWVWKRERIMQWRDRRVLHRERFFLGRADTTAIDTSGLDDREKSWTLDHRWWTADEIAASSERFEPVDLGLRLKALLRDGPPERADHARLAAVAAFLLTLALLLVGRGAAIGAPGQHESCREQRTPAIIVTGSRSAMFEEPRDCQVAPGALVGGAVEADVPAT